MERAYSVLTVKAVNDDQRIIEGIASTPELDRQGDIVEPLGVIMRRAKNGAPDVPIKFQHGKDPRVGDIGVGYLLSATPSAKGIPVRLQIAKETEPGLLKDTLDFVWQTIKRGLVKGLSIGAKPLETQRIKGGFGLHYIKWELLELSPVTIPANAEATIGLIKSIDTAIREGRPIPSPGVPGIRKTLHTFKRPEGHHERHCR